MYIRFESLAIVLNCAVQSIASDDRSGQDQAEANIVVVSGIQRAPDIASHGQVFALECIKFPSQVEFIFKPNVESKVHDQTK
jgi:hypothetical protein